MRGGDGGGAGGLLPEAGAGGAQLGPPGWVAPPRETGVAVAVLPGARLQRWLFTAPPGPLEGPGPGWMPEAGLRAPRPPPACAKFGERLQKVRRDLGGLGSGGVQPPW